MRAERKSSPIEIDRAAHVASLGSVRHTKPRMNYDYDIIICGGGIAGLWLGNALARTGYSVILIEKDRLGAGQTLASQGMIHGGQKYVLGGALTSHAAAISRMPERWQASLSGVGEIDLTGVEVISPTQVMWGAGSFSAAAVFAAAKLVNAETAPLKAQEVPIVLRESGASTGTIYSLPEAVLDVRSLLGALARNLPGRVLRGDVTEVRPDGTVIVSGSVMRAQRVIWTAGAGNERALDMLPKGEARTQRRPLRQIMVRALPAPLFGHGIVNSPKPRITVTSHRCKSGYVWYLGGAVAEKSASMDEPAALRFAKAELEAIFPKLDWDRKEWSSWYGDRAEPIDKSGELPTGPEIHETGRVLLAWPVKLTFAPALADRVHEFLKRENIQPVATSAPPPLPAAQVGPYPWEGAAWQTIA
jgi:glycine/D-amino acid oxidase-like deaminating enzyme